VRFQALEETRASRSLVLEIQGPECGGGWVDGSWGVLYCLVGLLARPQRHLAPFQEPEETISIGGFVPEIWGLDFPGGVSRSR